MKQDIHVAHSPDSDDAFMFYALATKKIDTGGLNYIHSLSDIETLNQKAMKGEYEVSAVSFHAYAYMADKYALLSCGASMGKNYGPVVVSGKPMRPEGLVNATVAIPGTFTTAFLALRLFEPEIQYSVVAFDRILDEVRRGKYDAGLLIHEGQLTYRELHDAVGRMANGLKSLGVRKYDRVAVRAVSPSASRAFGVMPLDRT